MMTKLTQPHDRFFNRMFSNLNMVEDILLSNIPTLAELIIPGSFEDSRDKFVTPKLERYYSDMILKAKFNNGGEGYIYLLLEHKSHPEPQVAYHLHRYVMQMWDTLYEEGKPLPFIFSVVIYHGKQSWNVGTSFNTLVNIPSGMEKYVPHHHYYLYDLSQYSDTEIKGAILSRATLLFLKHIFTDDFGERFIKICGLLAQLENENTALEYLRSVLEYIGNATNKITIEQVREGVQSALPQIGEEEMPTFFNELRDEAHAEGLQQGLQKGREEGMKELIELALELKYGNSGLSLFTKIQPISSVEQLRSIKNLLKTDISLQEFQNYLETL